MKINFLIFTFLFFQFNSFGSSPNPSPDAKNEKHPKLILSPKNISQFQSKAKNKNQNLFILSEKQAKEFCSRPLIQFSNAHNKYREIGDALPVLGLMYQINRDKKYVETAEKWMNQMLASPSWNGSQNLGRSSWIVGLCFLYDWMFDELKDETKEQLLKRLISETEIVVQTASSTRALSNHLLIETSAVGMLGLLLENNHPKKQSFLNQADIWANYIIDHAPTDGSWGEGVQYWQYGTGYFLRFLEAAESAGFKNYYKNYEWLKKTGYFPIYFSLPGNQSKVINFSDCGTDRYLPAFLFYLPAQKYHNPHFQDFGKKIQATEPHKFSWLDFLFYDAAVHSEDYTKLPLFKHFDDHGFVTMRSAWEKGSTAVAFRCGPAPGHRNQKNPNRVQFKGFGPGHQQPDINSFVVFAQNEWLVIDPGYTHLKETRNYNTILVNDFGQAGAGGNWLDFMEFESREPVPKIVYTEHNQELDYLIGDAGNIYVDEAELQSFKRHLIFLKPDIIIIYDEIAAKKTSVFDWQLQLNEIAEIEQLKTQFKIKKNNVEFWVNPVLPKVYKPELNQRLLDAGDVHGLPNHNEGILQTINLKSTGEKLEYLVVITIQKNKPSNIPQVLFENNMLTIIANGEKTVFTYSTKDTNKNQPVFQLKKE